MHIARLYHWLAATIVLWVVAWPGLAAIASDNRMLATVGNAGLFALAAAAVLGGLHPRVFRPLLTSPNKTLTGASVLVIVYYLCMCLWFAYVEAAPS